MQAQQEVTAHSMDLRQLNSHIRTLITLDEDEAPMVSCYLHFTVERNGSGLPLLDRRVAAMRKVLGRQERDQFEEAWLSWNSPWSFASTFG